MNHKRALTSDYELNTFPSSRLATIDIGAVSRSKHLIHAYVELDVTKARKKVLELKKQKQEISFNAWFIKCVSKMMEEYPEIHAIRKGKRQLISFKDIDIAIMIEREIEGVKVPLPYVLRNTHHKSIAEIYREIRAGQNQDIANEGNYVLGEGENKLMMKLYYALPGLARRWIWRIILGKPFFVKKNMGTAIVTFVGMMGKVNGWLSPVTVHPLSVAVGSIVKKPGVIGDRIEAREYLYVTVTVDHDVVDGAPAVRALSKLSKLVEKAEGLFAY